MQFLSHDVLQVGHVQYLDLPLLNADQAVVLKPRKQTADRLFFHAQVTADILARHAQIELGR